MQLLTLFPWIKAGFYLSLVILRIHWEWGKWAGQASFLYAVPVIHSNLGRRDTCLACPFRLLQPQRLLLHWVETEEASGADSTGSADHDDHDDHVLSDYELSRLANIRRHQGLLESLGLA